MLQQVYTATQLCYPKKLIHKFRHLNKLAPPLPPPKTRQKANRRRPHNQKQKEKTQAKPKKTGPQEIHVQVLQSQINQINPDGLPDPSPDGSKPYVQDVIIEDDDESEEGKEIV